MCIFKNVFLITIYCLKNNTSFKRGQIYNCFYFWQTLFEKKIKKNTFLISALFGSKNIHKKPQFYCISSLINNEVCTFLNSLTKSKFTK
ncbi:CTP synthetase [Polaribacter irgensii 23-P]|uniref:CTP synthetase n=1 Tax=Polaribacter irgensii 23-P TaxID=313594 RepID=A4C238_9FLAO|nr:CTP synthetase [Polaribacter irgensii 23-P]